MSNNECPLLEVKSISKNFPGVRALDKVCFNLNKGEVHVLLGENGAGKSTMIKILAGAYHPDEGEIFLDGNKVLISDPRIAEKVGIGVIHQEYNLVPHASVAENIFLGRLPMKGNKVKIVNWKKLHDDSRLLLEKLDADIDPRSTVNELNVAEQQMVEIAKALSQNPQIIIMDEPTAALSSKEIDQLFIIIDKLRKQGVGIIYVSHRMEEIFKIGDRITVFRDGRYIGTVNAKETCNEELIEMMVGRRFDSLFPWEERKLGDVTLEVEGLTRKGVFQDITFNLHRGEILGIAGLLGSGRSEMIQSIFGAFSVDSGSIKIDGENTKVPKNPKIAIKHKLGYLPSDRKRSGLILCLPVVDNITIASIGKFIKKGILNLRKERCSAEKYKNELNIKTPSLNREVMYLSGGNQQKVLLAKWLCSDSAIILFDEPTRGVDVGAKHEIYLLLIELVKNGKSVIMISSEMPELLGMCDRMLVMRRGKISTILSRNEFDEKKILQFMLIDKNEKSLDGNEAKISEHPNS